MTEPTPIPETHVFTGDILALREWGEATLTHYEESPDALVLEYDGDRARIQFADWDPVNGPQPLVQTDWINEGDTVTYDEKTSFGVRPTGGQLQQAQAQGIRAAQHELAAWEDRTVPAVDYDFEQQAAIARHPSGKARNQIAATDAARLATVQQLHRN